ncbi:MAG: plastocyanin/azurin family copper-binding protein [Chloroflexi bacterium]|nr:plastocyanin/azurin family copper-binding protein [Chloroflexota bacterium]
MASDIKNFVLQDITIPVGTTVDWTNRDGVPHTTTSGTPSNPTGVWDSPFLSQDDSFPFTFTEEGTFQYFCRVHPSTMQAVITVGPAATSVSVPSGNSGQPPTPSSGDYSY